MTIIFKKNHKNNSKAHAKSLWHGKARHDIFKLLIVLGIAGGVFAYIYLGKQFAWVSAFPVIWYMLYRWYIDEVQKEQGDLSTSTDEQINLNEALSADVLAHLKDPHSIEGIWAAAQKSPRAIFMINRFEINPQMFSMAANDKEVANRVWQEAYRLAKLIDSNRITGGEVLVALVSQVPAKQDLLNQVHIDYDDLIKGLKWLKHVVEITAKFKEHNFIGGVARDWTAGYTPILSKLGLNISAQIQSGGGLARRDVTSDDEVISQMISNLSKSSGANAALIGELGIGKTTTVFSFAEKILSDKQVPETIRYDQVYVLDATTLVANQEVFGSLENLLIAIFNEAQKAKNIILFFDDADAFFKESAGTVDARNIIQPIIENSGVRAILAITPTQWQKITMNNDSLAASINKITMKPPEEESCLQILENQAVLLEANTHTFFTYQAIVEAYRLSGHYIQEGEFPGKAIKLLESSTAFAAEDDYITDVSVQKAIESSLGVKVQKAGTQEKTELLNLEETIHQRMINQTRAVKVVSDALRRARSGVNDPNRPIGTFLFMGPTGVGKTELSKSVASVYFGADENMIRVDMNEFSSAGSGDRLIQAVNDSGQGLIQQIRRQPFSVVLFDEIEKADPTVLDLFLQMLDEGILKDSENKDVSFKDAIIIATSNAAAGDIQKLIADGKDLEEIEKPFVDQLISSGLFKPEFLNRFDEIVLFRPLTKDELLQVVDIIMKNVNTNLARQKVSVELSSDAKQWLVDHGYDARLGARPLRRVVQKTVENIVAKKLLDSSIGSGSIIKLNADDLEKSQE